MIDAPDLSLLTANVADPTPRPSDDPVQAAGEVFARIMVREVQRSLPEGTLLGGDFAPLQALVTDALVSALSDGDTLGLGRVFGGGSGPAERPPHVHGPIVANARVSSHFGMRSHPVHGALQHHDGIDLAAPEGSTVRAARAGVVVEARQDATYGNLVTIDHGSGLQTRYAHCRDLAVHAGEQVLAGQPIATVGQTGLATGPHLHFEVRSGGTAIDPHEWIGHQGLELPHGPQASPRMVDTLGEDPGT